MHAVRATPLGPILIEETAGFITRLQFMQDADPQDKIVENLTPALQQAFTELNQYLAGTRTFFTVPLKPLGTDFMRRVWRALLDVSYGSTASYKDIAIAVHNPKACRAVGMANHNNPIAIFIPCHRIIGSSGKLTGYAGGLPIKKALLQLESHFLANAPLKKPPESPAVPSPNARTHTAGAGA